jgi:hypothetical protein
MDSGYGNFNLPQFGIGVCAERGKDSLLHILGNLYICKLGEYQINPFDKVTAWSRNRKRDRK